VGGASTWGRNWRDKNPVLGHGLSLEPITLREQREREIPDCERRTSVYEPTTNGITPLVQNDYPLILIDLLIKFSEYVR
jgi:hypothetical protein